MAAIRLGLLSWRFDREIAGYGVLGDIMAHVTDMALYLAGGVTRLVSNAHTFIAERPRPIPGKGTHYSRGAPEDPKGPVTNEDYVGALLEFENGARGSVEVSRSIFGPKNQMAFELNGTKGAISWDFERMNELQLYLPDADGGHDGYTRLVGGDQYPYHGNFNPGEGSGLGYEDMKVIEAFNSPSPDPFPSELLRTGQFFSEQNIVANSVFCWAFSGDPLGRPYSFRYIRCFIRLTWRSKI